MGIFPELEHGPNGRASPLPIRSTHDADVSVAPLLPLVRILEHGKFHVSLKIIGKLAEVLGAKPAEFLRDDSAAPREDIDLTDWTGFKKGLAS